MSLFWRNLCTVGTGLLLRAAGIGSTWGWGHRSCEVCTIWKEMMSSDSSKAKSFLPIVALIFSWHSINDILRPCCHCWCEGPPELCSHWLPLAGWAANAPIVAWPWGKKDFSVKSLWEKKKCSIDSSCPLPFKCLVTFATSSRLFWTTVQKYVFVLFCTLNISFSVS